jgi:hypothetical protein
MKYYQFAVCRDKENKMTQNNDIDQLIDIETYGKESTKIPTGPKVRYKIRIDGTHYIISKQHVTGRELLQTAGKKPPEGYRLDQKLHGGATKKIELEDNVDLAAAGVERFMTLPLDTTEG